MSKAIRLFGILLAFALQGCVSIPLPDDHRWKNYFTAEEMKAAEVKLAQLNGVKDSASFYSSRWNSTLRLNRPEITPDVLIPIAVRASGRRYFHPIYLSRNAPVFFYTDHFAAGAMAGEIQNITNPNALPLLRKISTDRFLGEVAKMAALRIEGLSDKQKLIELIAAEPLPERYFPVVLRAMPNLSDQDAVDVLLEVCNKGGGIKELTFPYYIRANENDPYFSPRNIALVVPVLQRLSKTKSENARACLLKEKALYDEAVKRTHFEADVNMYRLIISAYDDALHSF